jgi:hypothetical protein
VAPLSGIIKSDLRVAVGFLLVFHMHRSSNSCRSQVSIDFQPSNIKPEVETVSQWSLQRTHPPMLKLHIPY